MSQEEAQAKVGAKELVAMLTLFTSVNVFLNYPQIVARSAMEAAWMEPIGSGILTVILFLVVEWLLSKYFPGLDIVEVAKEAFGSFAATLVAIVFGSYFVSMTASMMRQFMENVMTSVLPSTPISVIGLLFILSIGYIAYQGLEGIARAAYFLLPILILGILGICLLTINWWEPTELFPFWGTGVSQVALGVLQYSSIFANVLLLTIIYPHAHDPKSLRKVGVTSIALSALLLSGFCMAYGMVFPAVEAGNVLFPLYQLARMVYLGHFVQNLESVFIFMWVTAAVIKMAITLWAAAYLFNGGFRWPTYRPAIPALGVSSFALSMIPSNVLETEKWQELYLLSWGWIIVFGLPLAIVIVASVLKTRKRGKLRHA